MQALTYYDFKLLNLLLGFWCVSEGFRGLLANGYERKYFFVIFIGFFVFGIKFFEVYGYGHYLNTLNGEYEYRIGLAEKYLPDKRMVEKSGFSGGRFALTKEDAEWMYVKNDDGGIYFLDIDKFVRFIPGDSDFQRKKVREEFFEFKNGRDNYMWIFVYFISAIFCGYCSFLFYRRRQ